MLTGLLVFIGILLGRWLGKEEGWHAAWSKADDVYSPFIRDYREQRKACIAASRVQFRTKKKGAS